MSTIVRALLPLCVVALVASAAAAQSQKSSSTLITEDEIERARPNVGNALDVVQLLRPRWLGRKPDMVLLPGSASGQTSDAQMAQVHVYLEDRDKGDVEYLKTIPAELIYSLKYMSMTEVGARFGPSLGPGIVVTLRH